ncbi:MAG TPA: flagellar hook basal-body protein [Polyangiaceae bacterium]
MSDGIYVALSGAIAQSTSLDTTAANLANAGTDGYQRNRPVFREELMRAGNGEPGSRYTSVASTQLDTTRGALRPTGNALDFAMPEGTYLSVSTARGERYTRAASLSVGRDGTLQTSHGDPVVADDDKPIKIDGNPSALRIDDSGQLWQDGDVRARVKLVSFSQPQNLAHDQGPLLMTSAASGAATPSKATVQVGQVEESNANVVGAMTDLVTASRTFEAFQRIIDTFRDADRKVVTTVPDVT